MFKYLLLLRIEGFRKYHRLRCNLCVDKWWEKSFKILCWGKVCNIPMWKYSSATKSSPALTILSTIRCPKIAIISRYSDSAIHFRTIVKSTQCLFITRADCKGHHHSIIKSKENKRPGFRIMGAVIVKLHLTSIWHDFTLFLVTVSFLAVWAPPGSHRHR